MDLQRILNSREAGIIALRFSQLMPLGTGNLISRIVADRIAMNLQTPLVRAIRSNRWVVSGEHLSAEELDREVRATLRHIAFSYYTLFHFLNNPARLQARVDFNQSIQDLIARSHEQKKGMIVAGIHLSNFDLVLQAVAWRGLRALAISLPESSENQEAVEWQHIFRRQAGLEILPASVTNFRQAIRRLQSGEIVLTGIDRPIKNAKHPPTFFGRPAHVPIHHIQLALNARAPLMVLAALQRPDGIYQILSSEEILMRSYTDRQVELIRNAECVLEVAESFIRKAPEQWSITQPAWPETLAKMP